MSTDAPFGGGVFIADASAWWNARKPQAREGWLAALQGNQIATCPIVVMELLYSTRDADEFVAFERELSVLRDVAVTRSVTTGAIGALRELAHHGPYHHRIPISDALIAAAAQEAGLGVLHYDHHYDRLAQVLNFKSCWIAPPGTF